MNTHHLTPMQSHLPRAAAALALLLAQGLAVAGVSAEMQSGQTDAEQRQARSDVHLGKNEPKYDPVWTRNASSAEQEPDCTGASAETSDSDNSDDRK